MDGWMDEWMDPIDAWMNWMNEFRMLKRPLWSSPVSLKSLAVPALVVALPKCVLNSWMTPIAASFVMSRVLCVKTISFACSNPNVKLVVFVKTYQPSELINGACNHHKQTTPSFDPPQKQHKKPRMMMMIFTHLLHTIYYVWWSMQGKQQGQTQYDLVVWQRLLFQWQ